RLAPRGGQLRNNETEIPLYSQDGMHVLSCSHALRRRPATATASDIDNAMVAASDLKPAQSASATSNQTVAEAARGENALSVMATTGTRCPASARALSTVADA